MRKKNIRATPIFSKQYDTNCRHEIKMHVSYVSQTGLRRYSALSLAPSVGPNWLKKYQLYRIVGVISHQGAARYERKKVGRGGASLKKTLKTMMESGIGCIFDGKQFADKPNKCDRNGPNPATFESSSKDEYAGMT